MRLARLMQVSRIVQMPAHLPPAQSVGSTATNSFRPRRDPQLVTELTGEDLVPELVVVILPALAATLATCHYEWVIRPFCHFGGLPVFRITSRHVGRLARRLIFALSAFAASFACRPRARKRPPGTGEWRRHKGLLREIYRMFMLPGIRPSPASQFLSLAVAIGQPHKAAGHLSPVAGEAVRLTIAGIARERWSLRASVLGGTLRRAGESRLGRQAGRRRPLARWDRLSTVRRGRWSSPRYDGLLHPLRGGRHWPTTGTPIPPAIRCGRRCWPGWASRASVRRWQNPR